jgi:hypothetical protein
MSTEQKGVVLSLHERDWNGTMLYSYRIEGVDRYWRLGQVKPEFEKGDSITFTEANSNVVPESIVVQAAAPTVQVVPDPDLTSTVGERIRYQAARHDATRLVVAALHTDALPWTAVQQKNKSKKLDLLTGYIRQVTEQLLTEEEDHGKE